MKAPCVDCERKGCGKFHSQCEKYQEYWQECQKTRDEKLKRQNFNAILHSKNSVYRNSTRDR